MRVTSLGNGWVRGDHTGGPGPTGYGDDVVNNLFFDAYSTLRSCALAPGLFAQPGSALDRSSEPFVSQTNPPCRWMRALPDDIPPGRQARPMIRDLWCSSWVRPGTHL